MLKFVDDMPSPWHLCLCSDSQVVSEHSLQRDYSDPDELSLQWHEKAFVMHRFEEGQTPRNFQAIRAEIDRLEKLAADLEIVSSTLPFPLDQMLARAHSNAPILDDWRFAVRPVTCLVGLSSGHPLLPGDGRSIVTSEIFLISQELGWARSLSRWYRLGRRFDDLSKDC